MQELCVEILCEFIKDIQLTVRRLHYLFMSLCRRCFIFVPFYLIVFVFVYFFLTVAGGRGKMEGGGGGRDSGILLSCMKSRI